MHVSRHCTGRCSVLVHHVGRTTAQTHTQHHPIGLLRIWRRSACLPVRLLSAAAAAAAQHLHEIRLQPFSWSCRLACRRRCGPRRRWCRCRCRSSQRLAPSMGGIDALLYGHGATLHVGLACSRLCQVQRQHDSSIAQAVRQQGGGAAAHLFRIRPHPLPRDCGDPVAAGAVPHPRGQRRMQLCWHSVSCLARCVADHGLSQRPCTDPAQDQTYGQQCATYTIILWQQVVEVPAFSKGANAVLEELISSFGVADAHRVRHCRPALLQAFSKTALMHPADGRQRGRRRLYSQCMLGQGSPSRLTTRSDCCRR